jgi:hypothetical protein
LEKNRPSEKTQFEEFGGKIDCNVLEYSLTFPSRAKIGTDKVKFTSQQFRAESLNLRS